MKAIQAVINHSRRWMEQLRQWWTWLRHGPAEHRKVCAELERVRADKEAEIARLRKIIASHRDAVDKLLMTAKRNLPPNKYDNCVRLTTGLVET